MRILIVSSTAFETAPLREHLEVFFEKLSDSHFKKKSLSVKVLVTGIGMPYTAYALGTILAKSHFDLVINAGVAGAFDRSLKIGDVVNIISEQFGDLGAEAADGKFMDAVELGLIDPNQPPFINGKLYNPAAGEFSFLPQCNSLSVNKVNGTLEGIQAVRSRYQVDVESMEGAAFFLACLLSGVQFLEIRSISNYVEPRNKETWNLPLAVEQLNLVLKEILQSFVD